MIFFVYSIGSGPLRLVNSFERTLSQNSKTQWIFFPSEFSSSMMSRRRTNYS